MKIYVVYILTNKKHGTLYVGVTNNLKRRMYEHINGLIEGFTKKYDLKRLVYVEQSDFVYNAIAREKTLKSWNRQWKIDLIEKQNPEWEDLYEKIFGPECEDNKDLSSQIKSGMTSIENNKVWIPGQAWDDKI